MPGIRIVWYALVIGGILLSSRGLHSARAGNPRHVWAENVGMGFFAFVVGTSHFARLTGNLEFVVYMSAFAVAAVGVFISRRGPASRPA